MKGRRGGALAAAALAGAALLTGCAKPGSGRACTGVAIVDSGDGDREVSRIDCDYPPEGRQPGRSASAPLPD
ncbi:hypothetical protein [Streptomyces sp. NPDC050416]|uniref:hypothetical protein n=1 Tax=Streptomyces sp. NPDC050416 TaxID=3365611 RepID=UPI0037AFCDED